MKFLRIITKVSLALIILILILLLATLTTVDETPYTQTEAYQQTQKSLEQVDQQLALQRQDSSTQPKSMQVGWAKTNITLDHATPLAGYGNRRGKVSTGVRDSLWVRAFVFDNGTSRMAMIASDLLIIPPTIVAAVKANWPQNLGFHADHIYYGAIHSHNSEGGWQEGVGSELIAGKYDPEVVQFIAKQIITAITNATQGLSPTEIGYAQINEPTRIENRLVGKEGTVDPFIRLMKLKKQTGETALLVTYAAHATLLNGDNMVVSRDYPGVLVDSLEKNTVNFAAYMAGAVGSMRPVAEGKDDDEELNNQALALHHDIQKEYNAIVTKPEQTLEFVTVPVSLRKPQFQIAKGWKVRQWAWDMLFGLADADIKALRVGNIAFLGMPCDFSGELVPELESAGLTKNLHVVVTSFNGNYIGYVTPDQYWTRDTYESVAMNWFGPNTGSYFVETGRKILNKL